MRKQILSYLEKNSKMDSKEIAILLGTEPDVVENEIRKMEEEKIICGYHTMIDWDKTSSEMVTALIEVRVTPQRGQGFDSIAERIYKYPEVRSVYLISGGYDLMVILEGKTLKEVSQFVTDKLSTLSDRNVNIAFMRLFRESKGEIAYTIVESDGRLPEDIGVTIRQHENIHEVMIVQM